MAEQATLTIPKKFSNRIATRANKNNSLAEYQSASYYLEDLSKCLHPNLKSLDDAVSSFKRNRQRQYGVYLRSLSNQQEVCKIGKGYVANLPNGRIGITRDGTASGTNKVLLDEAFIPCESELAAEILEYYFQYRLGSAARSGLPIWIQKQIQNRFEPKFNKWLKPDINPKTYQQGGREEFDFSDCWDDRINIFNSLLSDFKLVKNIGKIDFNDKKHKHQDTGSDTLMDYLIAVGDPVNAIKEMKDFWMLIKPRGGKNTTTLLGVCKFIERMIELGKMSKTDVTDILFAGLWPSAFEGCQNDVDEYHFSPNTKIGYVDSKDNDWMGQRQQLISEGCNVIIIFSSIQSIDTDINNELTDNYKWAEQEDIEQEELNLTKLEELKKLGIRYAIIDECDHGMRTDNSKKILSELNFDLRIQLSGSDLYALKNMIEEEPKNYFSWTILDEMEDIDAGIIERPLLKRCSLNVKNDGLLPFDGLTPEEMNAKGYSRRILNMFDTYTNTLLEESKNRQERKEILKIKFNEVDGFVYDGLGNKIAFKSTLEIDRLLDRLIASENTGISIFEYQHIFNTVPTRLGGMALYNHIKEFRKDIKHEVKTGWHPEFRQARRIEKAVKRWMGVVEDNREGTKKTIFITVGRMLRGASCPWSCVIRMDDYMDFKIGHQIELRSQNSYGPDGKHCLVFDANPWRAMAYPADIAKYSSLGSDMNELLSTKCLRLIPFMLGELEARQASEQDVINSYMIFRSIRESFSSDKVFDETNLRKNCHLFINVDPYKPSSEERDDRAGSTKNNKNKNKIEGEGKNRDKAYENLLKRAKSVAMMVPFLQWLNATSLMVHKDLIDLLKNSDPKFLKEWMELVGLETTIELDQLIEVFDIFEINHQLLISSVKITDGISIEDLLDLSRPKKGDVMVPKELVKMIVDKLPIDWSTKPRVLDPSCGRGEFVKYIKEKMLLAGVLPDEIKNYLFYADRTNINISTTNKVIDLQNGFCYNQLEELEKYYCNMKFDVIVGNPPFKNSGEKGGSSTLWRKILESSWALLKNNGVISMITPQLPATANDLKHIFKESQVNCVWTKIEKYFPNIGSNFVAWQVEKKKKQSKAKFVDENLKIDLGLVTHYTKDWKYNETISKILDENECFAVESGENYYHTEITKNKRLSPISSPKFKYKLRRTIGETRYIYGLEEPTDYKISKMLFSYSGYPNFEYADKNNPCGTIKFASGFIRVENKKEYENLLNIYESSFYKWLRYQKSPGGMLGSSIYKLPRMPLNKKYSNDEILKHFEKYLDGVIIEHIKSNY